MNVLIINHPTLEIGGIENYCHQCIKDALRRKYRVIWIHYDPIVIDDIYKDVLDDIEKVAVPKHFHRNRTLSKLRFSAEDHITIVSFIPLNHFFALKIKKRFEQFDVTALYIVANTKGKAYYNEENYFRPLKGILFSVLKSIHCQWIENNYIRFFTGLQLDAFIRHYGIDVKNKAELISVPFAPYDPIDENNLLNRSERKVFNLVTVSRFDFPHKQYLLGLIDDYAELKEKYPQLKLTIIGYGNDEHIVTDKIESLPETAKRDVYCAGKCSTEKIDEIMKAMHLNISVAGSVACGARNGVLSIPARNFCGEKCEVYGFLPQSFNMETSIEPGERAIGYIEKVINMENNEFIAKSKASYEAYNNRDFNPNWLYEQKNRGTVRCGIGIRTVFNFILWTSGPIYRLEKKITGVSID